MIIHLQLTGDSGFVDAIKYLKERQGPPPKVPPRQRYTPLNASQREQVAEYTATNPIPQKGNDSKLLQFCDITCLLLFYLIDEFESSSEDNFYVN